MSFKRDSDWAKNKNTPDIVYLFADGTEIRYRKENGIIYRITYFSGSSLNKALMETEMTLQQFDELKAWSDDDLKAENNTYTNSHRDAIDLAAVENTLVASVPFAGEQSTFGEVDGFRTLENA